jgi:homoserine O-acetyltransferase
MLYTWQSGDVSNQDPYNVDFRAAMQATKERTLILSGKTNCISRKWAGSGR